MYKSILVSVVLAIVLGFVVGDVTWLQYPLKELSIMFTSMLKMCVVPLAFVSIAHAIISISNGVGLSVRAGGLAIGMSVAGVIIGLLLTALIGVPTFEITTTKTVAVSAPTVLEFINGCIPVNIFNSLTTGNMLQVITLAIITGVVSRMSKYKEEIDHVFVVVQSLVLTVANYVMMFAPVGIFALLYPVIAKCGLGILQGYLCMFGTLILGSIIFTALVSLPLMCYHKVDGIKSLKTVIMEDVVNAIAGGASNTIGPRMKFLRENTDIPVTVIDYITPLISVLMRAGSCICVGVYVIYGATLFGTPLGIFELAVVIALTTIALMCAPGIIGGTLMDCAIIFSAVGIPLEAITFLFATDYIMDLIRTILNIQGGEIVTACVGERTCERL